MIRLLIRLRRTIANTTYLSDGRLDVDTGCQMIPVISDKLTFFAERHLKTDSEEL